MDNGKKNTLGKCCAIYLTVISTSIASSSLSLILVSDIFAVKLRPETRSTTLEGSHGEGLYVRCMFALRFKKVVFLEV